MDTRANWGEEMETKRSNYLAYMLRIWRARGLWRETWRTSLEDAETHEVRGFGSLEALVAFLQEVTQQRRPEE